MSNNFLLKVDAYQAGMFKQIPKGMENFQASQLTHRKPFIDGEERIISAGLSMFVNWLENVTITKQDIEEADEFYKDFQASITGKWKPYPWPKQMFETIVEKYDGKIPVYIAGLPDGVAHYFGEPSILVWTDQPGMGECVGWLESEILPYIWQSTVVATRGRIRKDNFFKVYKDIYPSLSEKELHDIFLYKFHDFGRRGAANSLITGVAHLMNWPGTDIIDSAHYAKKYLNNNVHFGSCSIPAMAHRTVTSWKTEFEAYDNMIEQHGDDLVSIVADSYDYYKGVSYLAGKASNFKEKGGVLICRPDSGDPVYCILYGLNKLDENFGSTQQEVGLKVLNGAALIQGDGVSDEDIFDKIIPSIIKAGYCPSNVAFGMGQHNHKATRSMLETAYKTVLIKRNDGKKDEYCHVYKKSNSDFKNSKPGIQLIRSNYSTGSYHKRSYQYYHSEKDFKIDFNQSLYILQYAFDDNFVVKTSFQQIIDNTYSSWKILPQKNIFK